MIWARASFFVSAGSAVGVGEAVCVARAGAVSVVPEEPQAVAVSVTDRAAARRKVVRRADWCRGMTVLRDGWSADTG